MDAPFSRQAPENKPAMPQDTPETKTGNRRGSKKIWKTILNKFKRKFDQHNLVLADVKAEILPQIHSLLTDLGYRVITINVDGSHQDIVGPPANISPFEMAVMAAHSKDPAIRARTMSFIDEALEVFVPILEESRDSKFFKYGGFDTIKAILLYLIFAKPGQATPSHLFRIMADAEATRRCLRELKRILPANLDEEPLLNDAKRLATDILNTDKAKSSYLPTFIREASPKLSVFGESGLLADMGEYATTSLSDVRTQERVAIVIMTPLDQLRYMAPLTALIVMNIFQAIQIHRDAYRVHFLLDECPALAIPRLDEHANTIRGLGGSIEMYGQSEIAFIKKYSEQDYKQIRSNCGVQTFGRPNTFEEAKELSSYFGTKVEKTYSGSSQNVNYDDVTTNVSEHEVPIYSPTELMAMPDTQMVAKIGSLPPFIIERVMWWEVAGLRERLNDNPLEGKAPKARAKLKLKITKRGVKLVRPRPNRKPKINGELKPIRTPFLKPSYFLWAYMWIGMFAVPYALPNYDGPYIYMGDINSAAGSGQRVACKYVSLRGEQRTLWADYCPVITLKNPQKSRN